MDKISVFSYSFTEDILKQPEQLNRFKNWVAKSEEIKLYELLENGFKTFRPLKEESSWQYLLNSSIDIEPPFKHVQQISNYISFLIRKSFEKQYDRFQRENVFITDSIDLSPFSLKKCIEFNVELFENGKLLVHFLPVTKITSSGQISIDYIVGLKNAFSNTVDDIEVSLIEQGKNKRLKIDLFSPEDFENAKGFITQYENVICTFNYHFIAAYSQEIFLEVVQNTVKDIDKSIFYIQEILEKIEFDSEFHFQNKPFTRIEVKDLGRENNLLVGDNRCVNQQSAAYHNGMYKPANNAIIMPVLVDNYPLFDFSDLVYRFNKNCDSFLLLDPIRIKSTDDTRFNIVKETRKKYPNKRFLVAIFTDYQQPTNFIEPLKVSRTSFQFYFGSIDNFKLSNFTVKCLEKLGGLLCIINSSGENENTYFVGIDLGHSTNENGRFSNLAFVFFDNRGMFLHSSLNRNIPRNEALSPDVIWPCLLSFRKYLKSKNKPSPEKLIIHRDGKLHQTDIESILKQTKKHLNVDNVEIVEIIKHGFPVFAYFDQGAYMNLKSGNYYLQENYAILITNIQADERNAIVNPLIIKHKYGINTMDKIVKQVYWFTRIYTNNLYNTTRLPATTLKANNIVGTSLNIHHATYEG